MVAKGELQGNMYRLIGKTMVGDAIVANVVTFCFDLAQAFESHEHGLKVLLNHICLFV